MVYSKTLWVKIFFIKPMAGIQAIKMLHRHEKQLYLFTIKRLEFRWDTIAVINSACMITAPYDATTLTLAQCT